MERYERACCVQSYQVLTAFLDKTFVHDSLLHCLVCKGDHLRWQTCWQRSFGIQKTILWFEVALNDSVSRDQFSRDQLPPDQLSWDQLVTRLTLTRSICHEINSICYDVFEKNKHETHVLNLKSCLIFYGMQIIPSWRTPASLPYLMPDLVDDCVQCMWHQQLHQQM